MKFEELNLHKDVLRAVQEANYTEPTPIQKAAIPFVLNKRDVLGIAQTGTGKTASFTLPMISLLANGRARARMPRSVILCPTRELAIQVSQNFEQYGKYCSLTMALLIGGTSFKDQERLIDRGVDVLIATPGRLIDHFERGKLMMSSIEILVIDEADRMLDMGFIPDIERIIKATPFTRQTLFFSATMPPEITRLTEEFLHTPERIEVAAVSSTAETVKQYRVFINAKQKAISDKEKRNALRFILNEEKANLQNAIVFCNRKTDVSIVYKSLDKHGFNVGALHGDLEQSIRTRIVNAFREGQIDILVASDVVARGLDVPTVSHVFNFNVPTHAEDYVHRIGRTGRAGRSGKAYTLYSPSEDKYMKAVEAVIAKSIENYEIDGITNKPETQPKQTEKVAPKQAEAKEITPPTREKTSNKTPSRASSTRPENVVGLGDHVPAFLLQEIPFINQQAQSSQRQIVSSGV